MANFTININLQGRPAIYTPHADRPKFALVKGKAVDVVVLGIYQVAIDDDVDPYFVVVLPSGKCTYVGVESIQFTDCGEVNEDDSDVH